MITYGSTTLTSYNSIVKTEVYYYKSTSATSLSGGSWSTTKPTWENGKYIWQKIRTVYEDGTHTESDPVNITGQQGATGTAAYSYKLNSSDSIIGKTKDGEYTIKKITFSATYKQGTGAVSAYSGRFKIESTTNGSTWKTEYTSSGNEASKEFTIPDDIIAIKCSLYQSDGTTVLLDIVTVPVVKDGVDAIGLRDSIPYYLASDKNTGITRLTQGWTRYRPQLTAEKKYLWVYYVSRYSEGTTEPELIEIKDDLVHFVNNGDESPVESCVVDIEPVQDLHGYDSPWPAGGGKNLIIDAENIVIDKLGSAEGSRNEYSYINVGQSYMDVPDGTNVAISFDIEMVVNTANPRLQVYNTNNKGPKQIMGVTKTFTAAVGTTIKERCSLTTTIADRSDTTQTNNAIEFYTNYGSSNFYRITNIMLEIGTTASAFEPYSNICPITGWTAAKVTRTGKNLLNITEQSSTTNGVTFTVNSDGTIVADGTATATIYFAIQRGIAIPAGDYILTGCPSGGSSSTFSLSSQINSHWQGSDYGSGNSVSLNKGGNGLASSRIEIVIINGTTVSNLVFKPMLRLASDTATDYEPYSGQTYNITFPTESGTVYGGQLNVTTGELTVDRMMVDLPSDMSWATWGVNYRTSGITGFYIYRYSMPSTLDFSNIGKAVLTNLLAINNGVWGGSEVGYKTNASRASSNWYEIVSINNETASILSTDTNAEAIEKFKAFLESTPLNVLYELAAPITYQLTPQEITMLCKENNIFADTGQTAISYYDNQTSTDPYVDYSATSAFEYANTAINRATAVYGTCSTDAGTALKEVVCENFILFDGVRIQVAFENANSTNVPSLNVNNTGAKQILINQAIVSESNQLLWAEDAQMEFVYDGTYWVLQNAPYSLYGICSVTEEIPEKVIECAEAVICKGTTITVDFMYSNTSDNTVFNVANIAQKPLLVNGDVLKVNSRFNWHAGAIRTFYFDGQAWNMSDDIVSAYIDEYETEQDEDGIMVHPVGQKNTGWSIGSTLELLKNGVSYIKMWFDKVEEGEFSLPFIRIGKESGNHVLVGDDAVTIREDQKELAHYSSLGITFDDETPYKIGNDTTYIAFEDTDNDAKADSLRIVADSISFHSNGTEKDLRSELEGLNENIDLNAQAIEQNAEAIENTQKYIQIDPEVPSIKLATNDRNYLLIESNKLGFWVDANETAYMSQNQMNIPTASITNLLMQTTNAETGETIGQIGWVMRTNGHLSLKIMN